jgi:hypothetical protein
MFVVIEISKKGSRQMDIDFDSEGLAKFYADKMNAYKPQNTYTVAEKIGA